MGDLPPLAAIRAFEAAARHLSFTRAGAELGMTQAAVSYQVKLLEERLGVTLFLRRPRQVALTEAGRRLASSAGEAFAILRDAVAATRQEAAGTLSITSVQTFAACWLVGHLGAFQLAHPQLAVRLDTTSRLVDFAAGEAFDVGIRMGKGNWPGLVAHRLVFGRFTPLLSPRLAAGIGGVREPADLLKLPLLEIDDPWWAVWFEAAGVPFGGDKPRKEIRLGLQYLLANAAVADQGVALLMPALFPADIAAGRLIQPFELMGYDGHDYWLVYPEARRNLPKIRAFRDWLLAEVAAAGLMPATEP